MFKIITLLHFKRQRPVLLAYVALLLHQCGPGPITLLGHRAPSCAIWRTIGPYQNNASTPSMQFAGM